MFERILVPLDGSELARGVLPQIRRILFRHDSEVLLLRVVEPAPSAEADLTGVMATLEAEASEYLNALERDLAGRGARVRTLVREGWAAETILDVAAREKATMLAMSTRGRGGISRFILGSVAEKVLRASPVPVMAVRSPAGSGSDASPAETKELSLKKILVAVDAAELSLDVVPAAIELAKLFGSRVFLVNVCDGGPACHVPVPQLTKAYERFREAGVEAEPVMTIGDPASGILEACEEHGADLIAISTHGRSGISRWMLGSVAEKVLRAAPVPLLLVRSVGPADGNRSSGARREQVTA